MTSSICAGSNSNFVANSYDLPNVDEPDAMRTFLIAHGIIPSSEDAKRVFWSLGSGWWKQVIDGWAHTHGPLVFDEGLHGGKKEPGYLASMKTASIFFTDNFDKPFTLELYQEIHKLACSHFANSRPFEESGVIDNAFALNGYRTIAERSAYNIYDYQEPSPEMQRSMALNQARNAISDAESAIADENCRALMDNLSLAAHGYHKRIAQLPKQSLEHLHKNLNRALYQAKALLTSLSYKEAIPEEPQALSALLFEKEKGLHKLVWSTVANYAKKINDYMDIITFGLSLSQPLVECHVRTDRTFFIIYPRSTPSKQEFIAGKIIESFNNGLKRLQKKTCLRVKQNTETAVIKQKYQKEACRLIADLFAQQEWAHPWTDGQGRTDLIVLNGMLCQAGLHPCILEDPYYSSGCTLDMWLKYLKSGLQKFQEISSLDTR